MNRADTIEAYKQIQHDVDVIALAKKDLFFLMLCVMGRTDMNNDWLFARCREVQLNPNGYLDLWAREHYKSTIITVGLTIQNILNNPNITVGIFSHTRTIAKAFLRQIKREFEQNEKLQSLFPHICKPTAKKIGDSSSVIPRAWSEDTGIIVKRSGNPKESTIEAWGLVDGQPTGKHFDLLIYDDVVTLESVSTPEQIKKTTDAWRMSLNLGARGGDIRMIGTRYHSMDTYYTIMEQKSVKPRIHAATNDGTLDGEPVFLDAETLAKKRRDMGPYIYSCQMLQDPLADNAQGFNKDWFIKLPADANGAGMNRYIVVDPASSKKKSSDYTSMWVVGLNIDSNYYILDGVRDRMNLTERTKVLFDLHKKHRPINVGYEQYGMQADIEHIQYCMELENYRFGISFLSGQTPKVDRIRRLVPIFEQGRMFFPQRLMKMKVDNTVIDITDSFYRDEFTTFPVSGHDDMLDCLARILDTDLGAQFPLTQESPRTSGASFFQ